MTHHTAKPCPCGDPICKDWHVAPVAAVQGVKFTEEQAKNVARMLNDATNPLQFSYWLVRNTALKEAAEIAGNWAPNVAKEKIAELAKKKDT